MLKFLLLLVISLFISFNGYTQDIITKKNGEEIIAKILEVNNSEVKYKKFENQNGPSFIIAKSDLFMVKYEDGSKETFSLNSNKKNNIISKDSSNIKKNEVLFSIGPIFSVPIGRNKIHGYGYGGELTMHYLIKDNFQLNVLLGYQKITPYNLPLTNVSIGRRFPGSIIPFMIGGRYVSNNISIGTSLGFASYIFANSTSRIRFMFSPQFGYSNRNVDILGHYTNVAIPGKSFSTIGLKFNYKFKF